MACERLNTYMNLVLWVPYSLDLAVIPKNGSIQLPQPCYSPDLAPITLPTCSSSKFKVQYTADPELLNNQQFTCVFNFCSSWNIHIKCGDMSQHFVFYEYNLM